MKVAESIESRYYVYETRTKLASVLILFLNIRGLWL